MVEIIFVGGVMGQPNQGMMANVNQGMAGMNISGQSNMMGGR